MFDRQSHCPQQSTLWMLVYYRLVDQHKPRSMPQFCLTPTNTMSQAFDWFPVFVVWFPVFVDLSQAFDWFPSNASDCLHAGCVHSPVDSYSGPTDLIVCTAIVATTSSVCPWPASGAAWTYQAVMQTILIFYRF